MYCFSRAPEDEWRVAIHRHCPMSPFFKIGESSGKGTWRICWCSEVAVIGQVFAFQQKSRLPAWILQNELHPVSSRAQREYLWEYFREILSSNVQCTSYTWFRSIDGDCRCGINGFFSSWKIILFLYINHSRYRNTASLIGNPTGNKIKKKFR